MPRAWDAWFWNWLVDELDRAGLVIVPKRDPVMARVGLSARQKAARS